jgi:hypothetical protein
MQRLAELMAASSFSASLFQSRDLHLQRDVVVPVDAPAQGCLPARQDRYYEGIKWQ